LTIEKKEGNNEFSISLIWFVAWYKRICLLGKKETYINGVIL